MRFPEHCVQIFILGVYVEVQVCPWFKFYFPLFQTQTQTLEGLIFGGAYLRREICVSKSIGLALQLKVNLPFYFVFEGNFPSTTPGGLIFGGAI